MHKERELQESELITATRDHFVRKMDEGNPIYIWFPHHVNQVEKWANKILDYYPDADREVTLLSVWLHDIGHENRENFDNHEIYSEIEARNFLSSHGVHEEKIKKVAHCVRTHRCKDDALPESLEAKILAAADSASHITDIPYIYMMNNGNSRASVIEKLERDIRDTEYLPEPLRDELIPLQNAWKQLLDVFPEA